MGTRADFYVCAVGEAELQYVSAERDALRARVAAAEARCKRLADVVVALDSCDMDEDGSALWDVGGWVRFQAARAALQPGDVPEADTPPQPCAACADGVCRLHATGVDHCDAFDLRPETPEPLAPDGDCATDGHYLCAYCTRREAPAGGSGDAPAPAGTEAGR